jgi:hypothetical protein
LHSKENDIDWVEHTWTYGDGDMINTYKSLFENFEMKDHFVDAGIHGSITLN